ncbi:hypothetical protein MSAN_01832000 [Mycena sanguinolenta]|uniref:Uncharacterized protein n=1 Tax=Mycena sanguinolenta TaxID=230812 RepID=A0A8H7CQ54_9AGAR|nr:hypothetical protein MSAN_01832000 [Mycena sanguinolenta]
MASRRTTGIVLEHTHQSFDATDASPTPTRTDQEQSFGLPRAPRRPSLQPDNPNPVSFSPASDLTDAPRHSGSVSPDPSRIAHRRADSAFSSQDFSAQSTVPSARNLHSSSQTPVADTRNTSEDENQRKRAQMNADSDRPAQRARVEAPSPVDDLADVRNQSTTSTGLSRRYTSTNAAARPRARASNARHRSNSSQGDRNTNGHMEFPRVTGGNGGNGGNGRRRGGNGGSATGPVVIYAKTVNYYNQRS